MLGTVIGLWMWTTNTVVTVAGLLPWTAMRFEVRRRAGAATPNLVAAFDHLRGVVVGQVAVGEETKGRLAGERARRS